MEEFVVETWGQFERWLIHTKREPFNIGFTLLQPLIFLIFLGGMFSGIWANDQAGMNYRTFILPGIVTLTVFTNAMFAGVAILFDRETGLLTRLLAAPIRRGSIIVARFLYSSLVSAVQVLLMVGLAALLGARLATGFEGLLGLLGLGLLLGFGVTVVSLVLAFKLKGHGDFFAILGTITLPLTFLSSAFAPLDSMPTWMRWLAYLNPLTYAVEGMRAALDPAGSADRVVTMVLALVAVDVALFVWGVRALKKHLG